MVNLSCAVHFSRHYESIDLRWLNGAVGDNAVVILNSGQNWERNSSTNFREYVVKENVGRESYKYLSYIHEKYHHPREFAPVNIFCQINPEHGDFQKRNMTDQLRSLCNPESFGRLEKGFAYFGFHVLPYSFGLDTRFGGEWSTRYACNSEREMSNLLMPHTYPPTQCKQGKSNKQYQPYIKQKSEQYFVPGGCFAVSKELIYSRPRKFYAHLINHKLGIEEEIVQKDKESPVCKKEALRDCGNPCIGHFFERSWHKVFDSECGLESEWCCDFRCTAYGYARNIRHSTKFGSLNPNDLRTFYNCIAIVLFVQALVIVLRSYCGTPKIRPKYPKTPSAE